MASVKVEREMQDRGCAGVRSQVGCLQKHAGKEQDPPGGLALGLLALWLVHSGPFLGRPSQSWQTNVCAHPLTADASPLASRLNIWL